MPSRGIEEMEKAFASASGQPRKDADGLVNSTDVMGALKETLSSMAGSYSATQMAKVVKEIIKPPAEEQPSPLAALRELKDAGLINTGSNNGAEMKGVTELMTVMLMERGKEASEARQEARAATDNLLALAVQTMTQNQQQAYKQLQERIEQQSAPSPFQGAVEEAMAKILMRSLGDITKEPGQPQQQGNQLISKLQEVDSTMDFLINWMKKREQQLAPSGINEVRNPYLNVDVLRATLEDERERLKLKQEEERWKEELRTKDRAMTTAEAFAKELGPILSAVLNRGGNRNITTEEASYQIQEAQRAQMSNQPVAGRPVMRADEERIEV